MATLMTNETRDYRVEAHEEDLEAARTVSYVLFGVLAAGITIGIIGLFCALGI